jgi:hypothetical protein
MSWAAVSYVPLIAAGAWAFYAASHWHGTKGALLASSGVMVGLAVSSALFFPVLSELGPNRRLIGMSISRYTAVSISLALGIAGALAVAALSQG